MTNPIRCGSLILLLVVGALALRTAIAAAPPRAERPDDAVADLNLSPDQQHKADALLKELRDKEHQAREDFLKQMAAILTPDQLRHRFENQRVDQVDHTERPAGEVSGLQIRMTKFHHATVMLLSR
jgi:hypothetical protein